MIKRVSLIGAGNVATHLAQGLVSQSVTIDAIVSKNFNNALGLATLTSSRAVQTIESLPKNSDLYLVCVPDDAIEGIYAKLIRHVDSGHIIAHSSGSTKTVLIENKHIHSAVFYPLQTFSKARKVDLENTPFFISCASKSAESDLLALAQCLSNSCFIITDEERLRLHIAAVFTSNFTNHMFSISQQILQEKGLSFDILRPLLKETAEKALQIEPKDAQTGPALRDDQQTIKKHLELLSYNKEWQNLYLKLTKSIYKYHN